MGPFTQAETQQATGQVPFWFHSIDCGHGVITPGHKSLAVLQGELQLMALPSLTGKSVLDVGAWDGFFAFTAEALGARRVLALDHYVWSMDLPRQQEYWNACRDAGEIPQPYHLVPGHWEPGTLPGKRGFDTAHRLRGSHAEQMVADFMTADLVDVGAFDIVFFLGLLYHLQDPFGALKRLALVTRELAVIETAAVYVPGHEDTGLFEFYEANELGADVGNWFSPNLLGLAKACRAAGFRDVRATSPYPPGGAGEGIVRYRVTVHATH